MTAPLHRLGRELAISYVYLAFPTKQSWNRGGAITVNTAIDEWSIATMSNTNCAIWYFNRPETNFHSVFGEEYIQCLLLHSFQVRSMCNSQKLPTHDVGYSSLLTERDWRPLPLELVWARPPTAAVLRRAARCMKEAGQSPRDPRLPIGGNHGALQVRMVACAVRAVQRCRPPSVCLLG